MINQKQHGNHEKKYTINEFFELINLPENEHKAFELIDGYLYLLAGMLQQHTTG